MEEHTIKHVIFDFDGTIADSIQLAVEIYNQGAQKYKFQTITEESYEHLYSLSVLEKLKALNVPLVYIPRISVEFISSYYRSIGKCLYSKA